MDGDKISPPQWSLVDIGWMSVYGPHMSTVSDTERVARYLHSCARRVDSIPGGALRKLLNSRDRVLFDDALVLAAQYDWLRVEGGRVTVGQVVPPVIEKPPAAWLQRYRARTKSEDRA